MARTKQTQRKKSVFAHPFKRGVDLGTRSFKGVQIIKKIATGAFGRVYKGRRLSDGTLCALKFVDLRDEETKEQCFLEFELQNLFSAEGIGPKIIDHWQMPKEHMAVVITECWDTTLEDYLQENNLKKPSSYIAKKIDSLVEKLHSTDHVHLDLHSGNILLKVDSRGHVLDVALTDFGKATHYLGVPQERLDSAIKHFQLRRSRDPKELDWQMVKKIKKGDI